MKTPEQALKQYNRLMDAIYRDLTKFNNDRVSNNDSGRMRLAINGRRVFKAMEKWMDKYYAKGYVHAVSDMTMGLDNRFTYGTKYS